MKNATNFIFKLSLFFIVPMLLLILIRLVQGKNADDINLSYFFRAIQSFEGWTQFKETLADIQNVIDTYVAPNNDFVFDASTISSFFTSLGNFFGSIGRAFYGILIVSWNLISGIFNFIVYCC